MAQWCSRTLESYRPGPQEPNPATRRAGLGIPAELMGSWGGAETAAPALGRSSARLQTRPGTVRPLQTAAACPPPRSPAGITSRNESAVRAERAQGLLRHHHPCPAPLLFCRTSALSALRPSQLRALASDLGLLHSGELHLCLCGLVSVFGFLPSVFMFDWLIMTLCVYRAPRVY